MKGPSYSTYEAKARFSEVMRQVRAGKSVFISYRGEEVAEIRPIATEEGLEEQLERLERSGVLSSGLGKTPTSSRLRPVAARHGALERFLKSREPSRERGRAEQLEEREEQAESAVEAEPREKDA